MKRTVFRHLTLSASLIAAVACSSAFAGDGGNPVAFEAFEEVQGVKEFTGQMIIRPIQPAQGVERKLNSSQIAQLRDAAVKRIHEHTDVIEYVWQTDEYIVSLRPGMTENELGEMFHKSGEFDYAHPDWMCYPTVIPNDSRISQQWHHKSPTVNSYGGWDVYTGDPSVSVGICDTGVRTSHEDLLLHRLEGYNAVDRRWENQGGSITDINGHGTWCTGTAAANGNNGRGVSGMGWDLSHRMLRVTNSGGGGANMSNLTHAARKSVESGDRCASVSYSGQTDPSVRSTGTYVKSIGGLLFWAAGNEGRRLSTNNRDADDVLIIGSTTSSDNRSSFSNYGPYVDFMAGGSGIFTTDRSHNSSYASVSGTSFACPMAAGLGALIWSADPNLTPDQVEQLLKDTCTDLGQQGVDDTYGYGRIDSADALVDLGTYRLKVIPDGPYFGRDNVSMRCLGGDPNTNTYLFYSLRGTGLTEVFPNVFVDLRQPKQIKPTRVSDSNGDALWGVRFPRVKKNIRAFLQGTQDTDNRTQTGFFIDIQP